MLTARKIESGKTIYDYALSLHGGFDNLVPLLVLNPEFENMDVDLEDFVTKEIIYDTDNYSSKANQVELTGKKDANTIRYIRGLDGQNLYDLILHSYSGFDNIVKFLTDNNNSPDDHDVALKAFKFDNAVIENMSLKKVIERKGYIFATSASNKPSFGFLATEGLDYLVTESGNKILVT